MKKQITTLVFCLLCLTINAQESIPSLSYKVLSDIKKSIVFNGDKLKTGIFSDYTQIEVGMILKVAIVFDIPIGNCIYSNEKSTNNLPTQIEWLLPEGIVLEKVVWQKPYLLPDGMKKGYLNSAIVIAYFKIDSNFSLKEAEIKAKLMYQVCDELNCFSGENSEKLTVKKGKKIKSKQFSIFR